MTLNVDHWAGDYQFAGEPLPGDHLYFVKAADGTCKIGRSQNVERRLVQLRQGTGTQLELATWLRGHGWQERVWHTAFKHIRVQGEWFTWTPELARAVAAAMLGEEWIATLIAPPGEAPDYATDPDHWWRDHIADEEEIAYERFTRSPAIAAEIARLTGAPTHG